MNCELMIETSDRVMLSERSAPLYSPPEEPVFAGQFPDTPGESRKRCGVKGSKEKETVPRSPVWLRLRHYIYDT